MMLSGHIVIFCLINSFVNLLNGAVQDKNLNGRQNRHLPALFQFFRGLHGEESYHHLPPYYLLPSVLVLPSINQQQNTIIQESSGQENYQEINKSLHMKKYAKLVSNANSIGINETVDFNRTVFLKDSNLENDTNEAIKLSQFDIVTERVRSTILHTEVMGRNDSNTYTSNEVVGFYPPAKNNSEFTNSLSLTSDLIEEQFRNRTNPYLYKDNKGESKTKFNILDFKEIQKLENRLLPPSKKPYDVFNYTVIENNDFLPLSDILWQQFSTENKDTLTAKGFKPLAGLYYDGFLHKPLTKKSGFKPL